MIEELARHRCLGDDGSVHTVVAYRHVFVARGDGTARHHPGARWLALLDGEPVEPKGSDSYVVAATGQVLTHDRSHCRCGPRAAIQIVDRTTLPPAEAA